MSEEPVGIWAGQDWKGLPADLLPTYLPPLPPTVSLPPSLPSPTPFLFALTVSSTASRARCIPWRMLLSASPLVLTQGRSHALRMAPVSCEKTIVNFTCRQSPLDSSLPTPPQLALNLTAQSLKPKTFNFLSSFIAHRLHLSKNSSNTQDTSSLYHAGYPEL